MRTTQPYQYYVEGDTEKKMVNILKTEYQSIYPGHVEKFNAVSQRFTPARVRGLKKNTIVILVIDTDVEGDASIAILKENIAMLQKQPHIKKVICITQIKNLEDELKYSCKIRSIVDLIPSRSQGDFKRDMLAHKNFKQKLDKADFDFSKFWSRTPGSGTYCFLNNEACEIRIVRKK